MQTTISFLQRRGICLAILLGSYSGAAQPDAPPPPGKLYDVGGHKMHLYSKGDGHSGPAVILEAGATAFSIDWYLAQQKVAEFAPVCSYDRAGHAWSELGPRPRTMKQAVHDLHRLLDSAGIKSPYLMVGHSLGGSFVRVFAAEFPDDVIGVVLIDVSLDDNPAYINGKMVGPWDKVQPRQIPAARDRIRDDERDLSKPELDGYRRYREFSGAPKIEAPFNKLPEPIQKLRLWAMSLPQSNVTDYNPYGAEESFLLFADRIRREHPLDNKPLVVLTRKSDEGGRMNKQEALQSLSGNSAFAVSDFAVHEIHLAQPDLVVNAIRAVLTAAKTGGRVQLTTK